MCVYGTQGSGWVLPLEVSLIIVGGLNLYHLFVQILVIDQEVAIIVMDLCIIFNKLSSHLNKSQNYL